MTSAMTFIQRTIRKYQIVASKEYWTINGLRISYRVKGFDAPKDMKYRDEVGFIHLEEASDEYLTVLNVEVVPTFRGQGLGQKLYLKARDVAKEKGYKGLISHVNERTPEASRVWKKLGKQVGRGWWVIA
jgi:GNAT superfamily N-acetyltransferase